MSRLLNSKLELEGAGAQPYIHYLGSEKSPFFVPCPSTSRAILALHCAILATKETDPHRGFHPKCSVSEGAYLPP